MTVSNDLLIASATVIVRTGGLFWLKLVAMVLFMCMRCSPFTERSEMCLYDVHIFLYWYDVY